MFCNCNSFCIARADFCAEITNEDGKVIEINLNAKHISVAQLEEIYKNRRIRYFFS